MALTNLVNSAPDLLSNTRHCAGAGEHRSADPQRHAAAGQGAQRERERYREPGLLRHHQGDPQAVSISLLDPLLHPQVSPRLSQTEIKIRAHEMKINLRYFEDGGVGGELMSYQSCQRNVSKFSQY